MGGLLLLGVLIGGALLFGGGGSSGGASKDCGRIMLTPDMVISNIDRLAAVSSSLDPNSPGIDAVGRMMQIISPGCAWSRDTTATLVGANGVEFDWQQLVALAGDKTVAQLNADPDFMGFLSGPQREGVSPTATAAEAAGRFTGVLK